MSLKKHPYAPGENELRINNTESVVLGAERVYVGVNTGRETIKVDQESGLNYHGEEVVGQKIYDSQEQARHSFFVLDLETGTRGWYPGKKNDTK